MAEGLSVPSWVLTLSVLPVPILLVVGLILGLPRWSLPCLRATGLMLSWAATHRGTPFGLNTGAGLLGTILGPVDRLMARLVGAVSSRAIQGILRIGMDWFVLLALTGVVVLALTTIPPLRRAFKRLRDDWTLLSFALYGSTATAIAYTFEDCPQPRCFSVILSLLTLAAWGPRVKATLTSVSGASERRIELPFRCWPRWRWQPL